MLFVLSKIATWLVYPLGLCFLLAAVGLALTGWGRAPRSRTWGWRLLAAGLVILYLASNTLLTGLLIRSLERQVLPPDPLPRADGVIVLGGGITSRVWPRSGPEVNEAGDRLLHGANIVREGLADWMVCSGGSGEIALAVQTEAEAMQEMLAWLGVKPEQIILDLRSRTTYENAVESLPLVRDRGAKSVLLVTSAAHMPRSLAVFRGQARRLGMEDLEIIPAPCDFLEIDPEKRPPWYFRLAQGLVPSAESLDRSTRMMHEYYGLVAYRLRGWL